jgi:hypothetical protein
MRLVQMKLIQGLPWMKDLKLLGIVPMGVEVKVKR